MSDFINVTNKVAKATIAAAGSATMYAGKSLLADGIVYESDGVNWDAVTTGDFTADTLPDLATLGAGTTVVVDGSLLSKGRDALFGDGMPSSKYISFVRGASDAAGIVKDASGQDNGLYVSPTATEATALGTPGKLVVETGTGKGFNFFYKEKTSFDITIDSFILSATVNLSAAPAASYSLLGNGDAASNQGFYLSCRATTGKIKPVFNTSAGLVNTIPDTNAILATGVDKTFVCAWDAKLRLFHFWMDGELTDSRFVGALGGTCSPSRYFSIGMAADTGLGTSASTSGTFKNIHYLRFADSALPVNVGYVAKRLMQTPDVHLQDNIFHMPHKKVQLILGACQSNELGMAETVDRTSLWGVPHKDGIWPTAAGLTTGSAWPRLAELAGKRGVSLSVYNSARPGSSLLQNWCGICRQWANGMLVGKGLWLLSGGGLWQMTSGSIGAFTASTVAPTGTTTTTGADGITWTYTGVPTAIDTDGHVYTHTETSRFDPCGLFATAFAGITANQSFDERYALLQIGQTDAAHTNVTIQNFANGLTNATNYWKSKGCKVLIGMTVCMPSADARYQSTIIPARQQVLSDFASDPEVLEGADMYAYFNGASIPSATVQRSPVPSLMNYGSGDTLNSIHLNCAGQNGAADAHFERMKQLGIM